MKKLMLSLLAAAGLAVTVQAEGTGTWFGPVDYLTDRSSDAVSNATGQTLLAAPAILHKVVISSPAYNVGVSTNATFTVIDGQSGSGTTRFEFNVSTQSIGSSDVDFTFDIAMSSGIFTDFTGTGTNGKVSLVYGRVNPASPNKYKVWASTFMNPDTNVHNIAAGPVLLHKVIVLTKGTGTSILSLYDSRESTLSASRRIAAVDLTDSAREYTYNVLCSSGLSLQASGAGTVAPGFIVLYKKNPSGDYDVWRSSFTTGSVTTSNIAGPGYIFGGVVNGDSVTASSLTVYDSSGTANNIITHFDGSLSSPGMMYDVAVSSGITYSSTGNGLYSILYKRK